MRVLVAAKRQYTAKDLLDDQYGRLFEVPAALSKLGHEVRGLALSYRRRDEGWYDWEHLPGMAWRSVNALPTGLLRYFSEFERTVEGWRPDVIWAGSDALHAVLGSRMARRHRIPLAIDLYDNYESFGLTKLPGLREAFRSACSMADALTIVSNSLERHVARTYDLQGRRLVLGNGIRPDIFHGYNKLACRRELALPEKARLVGAVGALTSDRGITDLFEAFELLAEGDPNIFLAVAGPRDRARAAYRHPRCIDLGVLDLDEVPKLLSALDVAVVCNRDSSFGRYCFPLKFYEAIACDVPVVAAAVGDIAELLAATPGLLYPPGDAMALAAAIRQQIVCPTLSGLSAATWHELAEKLESLLLELRRPCHSNDSV